MPQGPLPVQVVNSSAVGHSWFVNETTGNDTNNGGNLAPFKTLTAALAAAAFGDTVYLQGSVHLTATLNWNKNGVSLVGLTAPSGNCRARISVTGTAVFTPLVNVTGQGCSFVNLGTFHGFADASAQVCWNEAGGRNFYSDVQFLGGGDATAAAQAGMRSLTITGGGENLFVGCSLGLDTVVRATNANATLELKSGTARNKFKDCTFQALVTDVSDVHVTVGAAGMDRYCLFDNCSFLNSVDSTGSTMSAAMTVNAGAGGSVIVQGGISVGATAIATTGPVYVNGAVPAATTSSIGIHAT
jgi:hypothetical protein